MRNFGLPCQYAILRIFIIDFMDAMLNSEDIHDHWFLYKDFLPVSNTSDARLKKPFTTLTSPPISILKPVKKHQATNSMQCIS